MGRGSGGWRSCGQWKGDRRAARTRLHRHNAQKKLWREPTGWMSPLTAPLGRQGGRLQTSLLVICTSRSSSSALCLRRSEFELPLVGDRNEVCIFPSAAQLLRCEFAFLHCTPLRRPLLLRCNTLPMTHQRTLTTPQMGKQEKTKNASAGFQARKDSEACLLTNHPPKLRSLCRRRCCAFSLHFAFLPRWRSFFALLFPFSFHCRLDWSFRRRRGRS